MHRIRGSKSFLVFGKCSDRIRSSFFYRNLFACHINFCRYICRIFPRFTDKEIHIDQIVFRSVCKPFNRSAWIDPYCVFLIFQACHSCIEFLIGIASHGISISYTYILAIHIDFSIIKIRVLLPVPLKSGPCKCKLSISLRVM